ncbi:MAG: hypothetical protein RR874_20010 [Aeromonas sp.]|uniref:hypothetical protein n=1 Tax=Aeromonas sp. TaxID=647 RepID=UPI002FCB69DB
MSGDNVMGDHDDQVIASSGSYTIGRLAQRLASMLPLLGPDVCDAVITKEITIAAQEAAVLAAAES